MHFSTATAAGLPTLATTALAGTANVVNQCKENVFLTITTGNQQTTTRQIAGSGGRYSAPVSGQGNSWGVTKKSDYYSASTPKLIWGFSDAPPTLYYTVSQVNGDAFAGQSFKLSASDAKCGTVSGYDGRTRTCADSNSFTLQLC